VRLDPRLVLAHNAKMAGGSAPTERPRVRRFAGRVSQKKRERLAALVAVAGGTTCVIPVRTVSESNQSLGGWHAKIARWKQQRDLTEMYVKRLDLPPLPVVVTMTRIGKRMLDDDNLSGSLKRVRDSIASVYGVDDGSPLCRWVCEQEIGKEYGVKVSLAAKGAT
jgi:hypothetical protein